jgi:hypothetical protein
MQMASGENFPIFKEALVNLILLGRRMTTWLCVTCITEDFILELAIMRAHGMLGFREHNATSICESVSLLPPAVRWQTSSYMEGNSDLVATCCGRVVRSAVRDLKKQNSLLHFSRFRMFKHSQLSDFGGVVFQSSRDDDDDDDRGIGS